MYESQLKTCNPVTGQWVTSPGCANYHLTVANPPNVAQSKLATAEQTVTQLQATVNTDTTNYQNAVSVAHGECAGTAGGGLSGLAGNGPLCKQDQATVSASQTTLDTDTAKLSTAQDTVSRLSPPAENAQQAYYGQLNTTITKAVAARKADLGKIGIIDEWNALQQLSGQSDFVFFGYWLLVLVMIALDCLPVLATLMAGTSAYDQVLANQADSDKAVHAVDLRLRKDAATADKEVKIYLTEMRRRERMQNEDRAERVRKALGDGDGLDDVQALAAKWLKEIKDEPT